MRPTTSVLASLAFSFMCSCHAGAEHNQSTADYWYQQGQNTLSRAIALTPNTRQAKNVILFVGDGHGVTSVTASRIFDGQSKGLAGEDNVLSFETFPHIGLAKTYNTNQQTPDSAGSMTALMTGVKTSAGVISVGPESVPGDCTKPVTALPTLLVQAQQAGKATGIVSTARITHATPAATYAHSVHRNWESDADIPPAMKNCGVDIASQLVANQKMDVVLGGGRRDFMPASTPDPEYANKQGKRQDGRDLIAEWGTSHPNGAYVWNREQFVAISPDYSGAILGLFEPSHMHYEADRARGEGNEPSLTEMTTTAIARLKQNPNGFFLMVEAGRIDHAHHAGNAYRALVDGQELANAVAAASKNTSLEDTLIIVTADHSHVLTMAGYPTRGNPILGKVVSNDDHGHPQDQPEQAVDGRPYTTLGYINGPGYGYYATEAERYAGGSHDGRHLTNEDNTTGLDFHQESLVPMFAETHGGEDVAIYAQGPWSHLIHGVHEQNYIYHVMRQALWPKE